MTRNTIKITVAWLVIGIVSIALLMAMNENDKKIREGIDKLQSCITKTAHAEGYKGNVHGLEAWQLFGGNCTK